MIAALRTELRKVTTTRTWWIKALVMFGYMVVMGVIMAFSLVLGMREAEKTGARHGWRRVREGAVLDPKAIATSVYTLAVALGYIFPAMLGAMIVTTEFRHRTITPTLLAEPRRTLVLGCKLAAILPFALVVALAGVLGTVLGGAATLAIMGEPTLLGDPHHPAHARHVRGGADASGPWSGSGSARCSPTRWRRSWSCWCSRSSWNRCCACCWRSSTPTEVITKFLPGAAGEAIAGSSLYVSSGLAELLVPWQGILPGGLRGGLHLIGRLTTFRRDIG